MQIHKHSLRFSLVFIFLILCLLYYSGKLIYIQVFRSAYLISLAEKQHNHFMTLEPVRGIIYDRRMRPLALNVPAYSLYANPRRMSRENKDRAVKLLSSILKADEKSLQAKLSVNKYFVWIARKLSLDQTREIKALKLKGLDFIRESKRYYPDQELAAHIIGFAGIDNAGLEGIELAFDKFLRGEPGWTQILRDARQQDLMIERGYQAPKDGFNIVLTIDETIQYIAERALDKAFKESHARAATIIVLDPKTGEVLALANRPTYDLSHFEKSNAENRTNRAVAFVLEPGSVFKVVAASAALEEGVVKETDKFFCENGAYRVGNHTLHDHHKHGTLTFREVIEQSSNIGTTKVAQKLGPARFYKYGHRFRFGMKTGIDLHGEVAGWLKPPSKWSATSIGAIPIGQEVTVTPIQLVSAISAIANNGIYMKPYVVREVRDIKEETIKMFGPQVVDQVISPETAKRMTDILVGVVKNGTGKMGQIEGIDVAGKTGTAQKVVGGRYSHDKFYATFFGFAPAEDPRLAAVVIVDEPRGTYFGGTVSAPVFKQVITDSLKYLDSVDEKD